MRPEPTTCNASTTTSKSPAIRRSSRAVRQALEDHKIATESAETSYIPSNSIDLDVENGKRMLRLRDSLDENEDVQNVYANDNIPEAATA